MKTLFAGAVVMLLGTSAMAQNAQTPRFEDYAAGPRYTGQVHRAAGGAPVDFAGHYVSMNETCGGGCMNAWIVDAKTGQVSSPDVMREIDSANNLSDELQGLELNYRVDSNLIRIIRGGSQPQIGYYRWDGTDAAACQRADAAGPALIGSSNPALSLRILPTAAPTS